MPDPLHLRIARVVGHNVPPGDIDLVNYSIGLVEEVRLLEAKYQLALQEIYKLEAKVTA